MTGHPWQPATDVEQGLHEARSRGDWEAYFDVLAAAHVFWAASRYEADTGTGEPSGPWWNAAIGQWCLTVVTEGMLPVPGPDVVFQSTHLDTLGEFLAQMGWWLAVNPGTPCEGFFPPNPQLWRMHRKRIRTPDETKRLRAIRTGPLHGPVAHGLACGAQLCVNNGFPWSLLHWHGAGYMGEQLSLAEWWGVESRQQWIEQQETLLGPATRATYWELVLTIRNGMAQATGRSIDPVTWRNATEQTLRQGGESAEVLKKADKAIGKIVRYEARFRADGLLSEGHGVRSVAAWHLGRASNMARWGLGARYCDVQETERLVVRAGEASRAVYGSWEEFGLGFLLGRCLHFDKEHFGPWFTEMVEVYRTLMSAPGSPWLNVPWLQPDGTTDTAPVAAGR